MIVESEKSYGGFLPLEFALSKGREYFSNIDSAYILSLNSGRAAITLAVQMLGVEKVYIPYYNCEVVQKCLRLHGISFEFYYLTEDLLPQIGTIEDNAAILCVNYFGLLSEKRSSGLAEKYHRVIFDNTQAFFAKPILAEQCFNVYSCRKFVGVSDGAYLISKSIVSNLIPQMQDTSYQRAGFLLKSAELGTNSAYKESLDAEEDIGFEIKKMSSLTQNLLGHADYERNQKQRLENYQVLASELDCFNGLKPGIPETGPFVYPFYFEDASLRAKLVENKIFIPQWWKYLQSIVNENSIEAKFIQYLYPLPVDHRYGKEDMIKMVGMIKELL